MTPRGVTVVGVDPGGRSTGIVTVVDSGRTLADAQVLERPKWSPITDLGDGLAVWCGAVLDELDEVLRLAAADILTTARVSECLRSGRLVLAVEGVVAPSPHQRRSDGNALTDPTGILATAVLLGAIVAEYRPHPVIVPPGGMGSHVAGAYPDAIAAPVNPRRKGPPADRNRHARSAYDVARAGLFLHRARAADTLNPRTPRLPG